MNRIDALRITPDPTARKSTPVTDSDLELLWQAYTVSRDEKLRNRLLVHYMPLSQAIARHMHHKMPASIDVDDLAQAAILGLRSAIATFDPSRGIPFENFCGPRVRGAVLDYLRSLDWAPRMLRSRVQHVQEMIRQMEASTGTLPTDEQLSSALQMPVAEVQEIKGEMLPPPVRISCSNGDEPNAVNLDTVADDSAETPALEAQRADLREFLTRGLSDTERQVLILYYYEDMSLREIGTSLKLCESRVSQIHHGVIQRLRERRDRIGGSTLDD